MKRRISSLMIALLLTVSLCVPALASGYDEAELNFVTDAAGILSEQEWMELEQRAEEISVQYQCGVYIIAVDDFTNYTYDSSVYEAAKTLYRDYALGYGTERSGELLLLSVAKRDYTLIAYGYGNTAFTDYGKDKLAEAFLDNFKKDDWYGGFSDYLEKSASMLQSARSGKPVDVGSSPLIVFVGTVISLLLGFSVAVFFCWWLKERLMKSVATGTEADDYLLAGSVEITDRQDRFTHTTETRERVKEESSSGGTTVDSDGFSGKSGKF